MRRCTGCAWLVKNTEFKSDATTEYQPATAGPTISRSPAFAPAIVPDSPDNRQPTHCIPTIGSLWPFAAFFPEPSLLRRTIWPLSRFRRVVIMVSACASWHRFLDTDNSPGGQASYPARTRTPAGQIYRHRTRRHYKLGVAHEHPSRHILVHCRPPSAPFVHCAGGERATDKDEG